MIIPFFIPHSGCPHRCVFCNQKNITGQGRPADISSIPRKIEEYLSTRTAEEPVQVAFYGGSFTALTPKIQRAYLKAVRPFVESGRVAAIRLSTRPDCIDGDVLSLLREHHVHIVELGGQSMNDRVLALSGRGHTAADTVNSVKLLREYGFTIGLQLMPGLPGDSMCGFIDDTVNPAIMLKPDFVRLYPALVIRGTPLEALHAIGHYNPLSLDEAVSLCGKALVRFEQAGIDVIRIGLQPTEELEKPGTVLAGPYHPAFRQLVESSLLRDTLMKAVANRKKVRPSVAIFVHPKDVSAAIGQRRSNVGALKRHFGLQDIRILADPTVARRTVKLLDS